MTNYEKFIELLCENKVKFIIIGGAAAYLHGSAHLTQDLDIVYDRSKENIRKLVHALEKIHPKLRGVDFDLPFIFDEKTIHNGLNFTFNTDYGFIDILGEVAGGGNYKKLLKHSENMQIFGFKCYCVDLKTLINLKIASGRPKDFEIISELQFLLEEKSKKKK